MLKIFTKSVYYITCLDSDSMMLVQLVDIKLLNGTDGFLGPKIACGKLLHAVHIGDTLHIMPERLP